MNQHMAFPPALLEMLAQQVRAGQLAMDGPTTGEPAPPPEPLSPEEARERAIAELKKSRAEISDIILTCNQQTEQGVLDVGQDLTEIVAVAESFINEVRGTFESLQSSGDGQQSGGIVGSINAQSDAMHEFMGTVLDNASTQAQASSEALEQVETIMRVGTTINEVARSSKMLALNASIEAARLGSQGRSFVVIASQMQALSERVHESNQLVAEMAAKLLKLLPQIVDTSKDLKSRSDQFQTDFTQSVTTVRAGTQKLESALDSVLGSGDARLATILQRSQSALSHLQFQDPVAQRLMRVDASLKKVEERQISLLECGADVDIERALQEELGGGVDFDDAPDSGEVMLF